MKKVSKFISTTKRQLAAALAVAMITIVLFLVITGTSIHNVSENVKQMEEHDLEQTESIRDLTIQTQYDFLNVVEESWEFYQRHTVNNGDDYKYIQEFVTSYLNSFSDLQNFTIVVAIDENIEPIFIGYDEFQYGTIRDELLTSKAIEQHNRQLKTINEPTNEPFGTAERFYYMTDKFNVGDSDFYVHIGFYEDVIMDNHIRTVDPERLNNLNRDLRRIRLATIFFMIVVTAFGIFILGILTSFEFKLKEV